MTGEKKAARALQAICDAERAKVGREPVPYQRCLNLVRKHQGEALPGAGTFAERVFEAHRGELLGGGQ